MRGFVSLFVDLILRLVRTIWRLLPDVGWAMFAVLPTLAFGSILHRGVHVSIVETGRVVRARLFSIGDRPDAIWINGNTPGKPYKFRWCDRGVTWEWGWSGRRVEALQSVAALS